MNWLLLFLGVPCGVLCFKLGADLYEKYRGDSVWIQAFLLALPLAVFVAVVVLVDNLLR